MMKKQLLLLIMCCIAIHVYAHDPILLKVGSGVITRAQFEHAYNAYLRTQKSNVPLNHYLGEYINDQLKIAEANALGFNATPDYLAQVQSFRSQLILSLLLGQELVDTLHCPTPMLQEEILVAQIFKYLPQNATSAELEAQTRLMTLLHTELAANPNSDFLTYVDTYSDNKTQTIISRLHVTPEFEQHVFGLMLGEISAPFYTPSGIHIVKMLQKNVSERNYPQVRITAENRASALQMLKRKYHYTPYNQSVERLIASGYATDILFTLDGHPYTGVQFAFFAENNPKGIQQQFNDFVTKSVFDYAYRQLDTAHSKFHLLLREYQDQLLLSAITHTTITEKAQADRAGLIAYFTVHRKKYRWEEPRFKGIVIHSRDKKILSSAKRMLKKRPIDEWSTLIHHRFNADGIQLMQVEQGTYAKGDNPFVDAYQFKTGAPASPSLYPFTAVIGKKVKGPEHYEEAFPTLVSDYRAFLESLWLSRLRDQFNVEIDQEVLKTVNNH